MARKNNNLTGPGPGRPKGSLNKIPGDLKLAFMDTFEAIGGTDQLAEWAKKNLEAYYKITSRLFPRSEVNVDVQQSQGLHNIPLQEIMEQAERVWDGSKEEQEQDRKDRVVMNKKKYGPDYWDKELTEDEMSPSVRKVYRKLKSMYRQKTPQ